MNNPAAVLLVLGLTCGMLWPGAAHGQVDQSVIAANILDGNVQERRTALQVVQELGPDKAGPSVRRALILALEREGALRARRHTIAERGGQLPELEDPLFIAALTRIVVELQEPDAIPALAAAMGTGSTASMQALARFGEKAAPALLGIVTSEESRTSQVDWALIALRMMVENKDVNPLSDATLEQIRSAARDRLTGTQSGIGSVLRWTIDLAVVLGDPELRRIVERIASDPHELIARGLTEPDLIEKTQKRAADRLAGIPPKPRLP